MPSGDVALDDQISTLVLSSEGLQDAIDNLLFEIAGGNSSTALRRKLSELEDELSKVDLELKSLLVKQERSSGRAVAKALKELRSVASIQTSSSTELNTALRRAFSSVVVDYRCGMLCFNWKQGGVTEVAYTIVD